MVMAEALCLVWCVCSNRWYLSLLEKVLFGIKVDASSATPTEVVNAKSFDASLTVCIVRNNNKYYQRMDALVKLTEPQYREDVISNNLQEFIISGKSAVSILILPTHLWIEYQEANDRLGNVPATSVWSMLSRSKTPYLQTLLGLLGELPIVIP